MDFFLFFIKIRAVLSHNSSFIVNFAAKKTGKLSNCQVNESSNRQLLEWLLKSESKILLNKLVFQLELLTVCCTTDQMCRSRHYKK